MFVACTASSAPASTAPAWVAISGTLSAIITATGVIIAGGFAYFKFIKGRTFRPRCSLDIGAQLTKIGESRALQVSITVRNEGLVALLFPSNIPQRLFVGQADSAMWKQASDRQRRVVWERSSIPKGRYNLAVPEGNILELPTMKENQETIKQNPPWWRRLSRRWMLRELRGDKLEPGELWVRTILIPVSSDSVAYLVRARVSACRHLGVRHVIWHRRRCLKTKTAGMTWLRDIYLLPAGSDSNGHATNQAARI